MPFSSRPPGPTAMISPSWGFSLAVSGMMIPPLVFSSPSRRLTTTRSCKGRKLMFLGSLMRRSRRRTVSGWHLPKLAADLKRPPISTHLAMSANKRPLPRDAALHCQGQGGANNRRGVRLHTNREGRERKPFHTGAKLAAAARGAAAGLGCAFTAGRARRSALLLARWRPGTAPISCRRFSTRQFSWRYRRDP